MSLKAQTDQVPNQGLAVKVPLTVWILTALFGLFTFVSLVGPFIFSFPMGFYAVGVLLLLFGIVYATITWRLRKGERAVWILALVLPLVQQLGLNGLDLFYYGSIPSEDYPIMGLTLVMVVLLLLPSTRRFCSK